MSLSEEQREQLTQTIKPLVADLGIELVYIELKQAEGHRQVLEITLDKEGGINLDDCALASKKVSLVLDVEDIFPFHYSLEVSSPGMFRILRTDAEFKRFTGERVKAILNSPLEGKKKFVGTLKGFSRPDVTLLVDEQEIIIDLNQINKIHLFPEF